MLRPYMMLTTFWGTLLLPFEKHTFVFITFDVLHKPELCWHCVEFLTTDLCAEGCDSRWGWQAECYCSAWWQTAGQHCCVWPWSHQATVGKCSCDVESVVYGRWRTLSSVPGTWWCHAHVYRVFGSAECMAWQGWEPTCWSQEMQCWNSRPMRGSPENSQGMRNCSHCSVYLQLFMSCTSRSPVVDEGRMRQFLWSESVSFSALTLAILTCSLLGTQPKLE